ncbi:tetratricopeptide repeat-containing sensor histidine kinase [Marinoscillum furvescens]|uniref:Histidine kinase n=1 Tax=Marinoscillum furvescens DSM 4134 TaxID=1122208 RepID=A0A3D9L1H6_MARFU|nr:histidine kinase [Marinoscillum furvescens]RED95587.1 histidine kinase [Marinoscillum furvescens DSM 4134]
MKSYFFAFLILGAASFVPLISFAQSASTVRVDSLNALLSSEGCSDKQKAASLIASLQDEFETLEYQEGFLTFLRNRAYSYYCFQQMDSAAYWFVQGAKHARSQELWDWQGEMLKNAGNIFLLKADYDSSMFFFERALQVSNETGDSTFLPATYIGKGIVFQHLGELEQAMDAYLQAERISRNQKNLNAQVNAYLNRLTILSDHYPDRIDLAELYATLELCRKHELRANQTTLLQFTAGAAADSGKWDVAMAQYEEGLQIANEIGRIDLEVYHLEGLAELARKRGEHQAALKYIEKGLLNAEKAELVPNQIQLYLQQANISLEIGDYSQAVNSAQKCIALGESTGQKEVYYKAYKYLSNGQKSMGNLSLSLDALEKYIALSEEVLNEQKSNQLSELQTQFESEIKDNEIASLTQEASIASLKLDQQRFMIFGLIVLVIAGVGIGTMFVRQQRLQKKQQMAQIEQRLLRSQMNPHFIFNSMTAIQHYMLQNGAEKAGHYMGTFSKLMRQILEHSRVEFISLGEEVDTLRNYLELQLMRFGNRFAYAINIDETLDENYHHLPPMFAQPFIENSLEHGLFKGLSEKNHIEISMTAQGKDEIAVVIEDTGVGLAEETTSQGHRSLATQITQERLAAFKASSQLASRMKIENKVNEAGEVLGVRVALVLPVKVLISS